MVHVEESKVFWKAVIVSQCPDLIRENDRYVLGCLFKTVNYCFSNWFRRLVQVTGKSDWFWISSLAALLRSFLIISYFFFLN